MILPPWLWRLVHSRKFWILLIGTPVLGLVLFYTIANAWGARKLEEARKELSAKGYALTWKEVMQSGVAPEEDLLRHAVMLGGNRAVNEELQRLGHDANRLDEWDANLLEGKPFSAAEICGIPPTEEDAAVEQLLADLATMEPRAREIAAAIRSSKGIGWRIAPADPLSMDPSIGTAGWMGQYFSKRAVLRAAAGDTDGALDDMNVLHEYLEITRSKPKTLLFWIIERGIVKKLAFTLWQISRMPTITQEQLLEMIQWLRKLDTGKSGVDCYRGELVFMNESVSSMFGSVTAVHPDQMVLQFSWMDARQWWLELRDIWKQARPVGLFKADLADALLRIDREIIHRPDGSERQCWTVRDAERIEALIASFPPVRMSHAGFRYPLYDDFLAGMPSIIRGGLEIDTIVRLCRTAIAAQLHFRDRGQYPSSLDDLVPTYLDEVPDDPITETPIQMETTLDEVIIFVAKGWDLRLPVPAR